MDAKDTGGAQIHGGVKVVAHISELPRSHPETNGYRRR
jgi:hypothetical protein